MNWNYPTNIKVGAGCINELIGFCDDLGIINPLLVTDPILAKSNMVQNTLNLCKKRRLDIDVFHNIKPNPTGSNVINGVHAFQTGGHDGVIAIGGGSAIDAAKAIALICNQQGDIWDYEDVGDNWKAADPNKIPPIIAIPTTAGTGSEVGRASVITDEKEKRKKIIFHPKMVPDIVILDPELTINLPPHLTAATGMDALSHNLEAYCADTYHPMAEGIAMEGIKLIKENLLTAVNKGHDINARQNMLVASMMGATAFQRGLGAMHALAHPLGAIYDAHHGRLNAILMPYVLRANQPAIQDKIELLSNYLGVSGGFEGFLNWVLQLRNDIGIEKTLKEMGIDESNVEAMADMATKDAAAQSNPIIFNKLQYEQILISALNGDLNNNKQLLMDIV